MIGQKRLLDELDSLKTLPRTMIISGSRGSGKKLIAKKIAEKLDAEMIMCDGKVDTVREVTELAYKLVDNIMYVFPNVENMSPAAKNALLKITEEPPNKSYFVLTTTDLSQVWTNKTSLVRPIQETACWRLGLFPHTASVY